MELEYEYVAALVLTLAVALAVRWALSSPSPQCSSGRKVSVAGGAQRHAHRRPLGALRGQGPRNPGVEKSYKKLKYRAAKEDERARRRVERAEAGRSAFDSAAAKANILWTVLKKTVFKDTENCIKEEKLLKQFYNNAIRASISQSNVDGVEMAYALDKFASRADQACCLLLKADQLLQEKSEAGAPGFPPMGSAVSIACVGGGPANDAFGFFLFNAIRNLELKMTATVYDFAPGWQVVVDLLSKSLNDPDVLRVLQPPEGNGARPALSFQLCDLQKDPSDPVNQSIVSAAPHTQFFIFSYSLHESSGLGHTLFPALLQAAPSNSVFLVIEVFKEVVTKALDMGKSYGFEAYDVEASPDTAFNGGFMVKS
ncbi:hypothetical protein DIPPA_05220 [Diplonema papillatum]|nr:hypothetical protein DIPPA_05220 [Diplonema papillatum]|eukprot:gene8182-12609_t